MIILRKKALSSLCISYFVLCRGRFCPFFGSLSQSINKKVGDTNKKVGDTNKKVGDINNHEEFSC